MIRYPLSVILFAVILQAQTTSTCASGSDQFEQHDYEKAQSALWLCLESGKATSNDALDLALTYRTLKNYDSGLTRAGADLRKSPDDSNLLYFAGYLQYRRNDLKDSMLLLSKAYKLQPDDWRIHQLFALNYIGFHMPDAVERELQTAVRLNPGNSELHYQLGRLYYSEDHFPQALKEITRAVELTPDYPQAFDSIGLCYEAEEHFAEAAQNYKRAIELDRKLGIKDEWPLLDYGSMLLREESAAAGLPYLMEALATNPNSPNANYQAARAMRSLDRLQEAQTYFEKTIALDPNYSYAYYQLASLIRARGESRRAAVLMSKYKSLMDQEVGSGTYNPSSSAHTAR